MKTEPKKRSKSLVYPLIYLAIGVVVGGFIAVQIVTTGSLARSTNPIQPVLELGETIEEMRTDQKDLKDEIKNLRAEVEVQQDLVETRRATSKELNTELDDFETIVGLRPMQGQGIVVTMDDGEYEGLKDRNDFKNDAIIHSTDILDVVNMLWVAGAEAIAINDERVVGTTSINCIVNTILVNESHVGTPLEIRAIGDSEELARFINDPGRLTDLHSRQREYNLVIETTEAGDIQIPAFTGTYEI